MATNQNLFALLNDEESDDDVSKVIESVKASSRPSTAEDNRRKHPRSKFPSSDSVRADGRGGKDGRARDSQRSSGNEVEQFGSQGKGHQWSRRYDGYVRSNGHPNGYHQQNNGQGNSYPRNDRRGDGNFHDDGPADGDRQDNQTADQPADGNSQNEWVDIQRRETRKVDDSLHYYPVNYGKNVGGYTGSRGREFDSFHENVTQVVEEGEQQIEITINGDNSSAGSEGDVPVTTEVSKEELQEQQSAKEEREFSKEEREQQKRAKEEWEYKQRRWEERRKEKEENEKLRTLKDYEKQLSEKQAALEKSRKQEREVNLDKEFESMQVISKKNEDSIYIKLKSEDKLKKKKDSIGKDEKVSKTMSLDDFRQQTEDGGGRHDVEGRGRGYSGGRGGASGGWRGGRGGARDGGRSGSGARDGGRGRGRSARDGGRGGSVREGGRGRAPRDGGREETSVGHSGSHVMAREPFATQAGNPEIYAQLYPVLGHATRA